MNELIAVEKIAQWQKLKGMVLDSVSSPITKRGALNEFMDWFQQAARPGFTKATVSAWRLSLESTAYYCLMDSHRPDHGASGIRYPLGRITPKPLKCLMSTTELSLQQVRRPLFPATLLIFVRSSDAAPRGNIQLMRLLVKFSAIFTLVFGIGVAIIGGLTYRMLEDGAHSQVLAQAQLMMEAMSSVRKYTTVQVLPLLAPEEARTNTFLPQTVPAYAATENFVYLRSRFPDYSYKEATLNPTNPRDRAVDWEADVVTAFRNQPNLKQLSGERDSATGRSLFFAQPIRAGAACLECHSRPDLAPPAMLARYGSSNGFGWKEGEIIAAQVISLPLSVPLAIARDEFRTVLLYLGIIFLGSLVVLNAVLYFTITKPAAQLSDMANRISLGDLEVPELPVKGGDEIADLAGAFNRMRRSLVTAMKMIDDGDK